MGAVLTALTATDTTREHYQRPEVKAIITRFALPGEGAWRALNGDFWRWYSHFNEGRLLNATKDYDQLVDTYRTLYQTLNVFDPSLWMVGRTKDEITDDNPLGTLAETEAYTLGTDIDKGHGCNIEDAEVKQAVEAAAQFLVDYLRDQGVHDSVWVLFSGGGIYVEINHQICKPNTVEGRKEFFEMATDAYNSLIGHISEDFFKAHPEYIGKVKYDALNNAKRVFKCVLSIHKKKPYAVTPLNRDAIKIDFDRARVPLSMEMIEEAGVWYSTYNPAEREPLLRLLDQFKQNEEEKMRSEHHFKEIRISGTKTEQKDFPPCIRHILDTANPGEGKTRFTAVLATFLYQMGWDEEEAWCLVKAVSDRNGLDNADHIFDSCFGRLSCPSCRTIQDDGAGYPHLGLKGLGACNPDEKCDMWPGDYGVLDFFKQMGAKKEEPEGPTVLDAFKAMLEHDSEVKTDKGGSTWEWRVQRPRIKYAVKKGAMSQAAEEKAHKFLGQYKKILKNFGIDYDNLFPLAPVRKSNKEEFPPEIKAKAIDILKTGDPVQYIVDGCGSMVIGAENAFRKLVCCISTQNINQSAGLHPKLNGESSGGKTFTVYTFAHHMPSEAVVKGSMSAKAGFYHHDGNRVFRILDDYQAGNEDLDTTIKQTSSEFHSPYKHRTVVNQMAAVLEIGSEQTWAITSVDSSQEIQVLNRQMPINVDDSLATTRLVNDRTIARYCDGERQYPVNETVLVSRCILQTLRDEGYIDVRIPFKDRIEWLDTSNRRNPSIFMDLVIAHTAMFRHQRAKDPGGYYLATIEDFQAARGLFSDKDGEELVKRLTQAERETLEFLVSRPNGVTQNDLAEKLGVSRQRAATILYGQKGAGGLQAKVAIAETKVSEMIRISDDERKTVHKTLYSLKDYDRFAGFDAVVRLKPQADEPRNPGNDDATGDATENTGRGSNDATIAIIKEREREEEEERGCIADATVVSLEKEKKGCNRCMISPDSDKDRCTVLAAPLHDLPKEAIDSDKDRCTVSKKPKTYSEMAGSVPYDTSSPEAEKICQVTRGLLVKGIAPRIDFLTKETGLSAEAIESYLNNAPWIRKDDSSPAGIVVYLPIEAKA